MSPPTRALTRRRFSAWLRRLLSLCSGVSALAPPPGFLPPGNMVFPVWLQLRLSTQLAGVRRFFVRTDELEEAERRHGVRQCVPVEVPELVRDGDKGVRPDLECLE